jgi:hypothetical protein
MRRANRDFTTMWTLLTLALPGSAAACSGDDGSEAFSFADDDLCEWVSTDDVAAFYASAYDWEGTAETIIDPDTGQDECWWRLTDDSSDGYVEIGAGNAGGLLPYDEITQYEGGPVPAPGGTVSGHPALSDGAVVQSAGWGAYAFWVPPRTEYLSVSVIRFSGEGAGVPVVGSAIDEQSRLFSLADQFLNELDWVS